MSTFVTVIFAEVCASKSERFLNL